MSASRLGEYYRIDGRKLSRLYKDHLSDYRTWDQLGHASDWILLADNIGPRLCIDETEINGDLFTILSNPEGHGKDGSVVAMVRGTRADVVLKVLMLMGEERRLAVREVSMDFSESMLTIVNGAFPEAMIVTDKFHMIKLAADALEELRLRYKREAVAQYRREERRFNAKVRDRKKRRSDYRKKHKCKCKGKKRGRKPIYVGRYKPEVLANGDTLVELLTRSKYLLSQPGDKWTVRQKERARLLFERYPKIREVYSLVCSLRQIFNSDSSRERATELLQQWYGKVTESTVREIKSVRDTIRRREEHVMNYFVNRSTNAPAESLNSKIKCFRAELRGVGDAPYFMYRVATVLG